MLSTSICTCVGWRFFLSKKTRTLLSLKKKTHLFFPIFFTEVAMFQFPSLGCHTHQEGITEGMEGQNRAMITMPAGPGFLGINLAVRWEE